MLGLARLAELCLATAALWARLHAVLQTCSALPRPRADLHSGTARLTWPGSAQLHAQKLPGKLPLQQPGQGAGLCSRCCGGRLRACSVPARQRQLCVRQSAVLASSTNASKPAAASPSIILITEPAAALTHPAEGVGAADRHLATHRSTSGRGRGGGEATKQDLGRTLAPLAGHPAWASGVSCHCNLRSLTDVQQHSTSAGSQAPAKAARECGAGGQPPPRWPCTPALYACVMPAVLTEARNPGILLQILWRAQPHRSHKRGNVTAKHSLGRLTCACRRAWNSRRQGPRRPHPAWLCS